MSAPSAGSTIRPKILVVEDEDDLRRMLIYVLGTIGDVTAAGDGLEALSRMQSGFLPDVIVTDLMMPKMDGLQLAAKLKGDPILSRIPLVMLTAKTGAKDMIAGINAGARHYVTKPFKTDELIAKVRKALAVRGK